MYRLDSKDIKNITALIRLIRPCQHAKPKLKGVLSKMLKLFRAEDAVFFSGNQTLSGIDWANSFSIHGDKSYLAQYANHYWRYDPLYPAQFSLKPVKLVFKTDDIIPYSQMVQLEYYNEFLRPQHQLGELIIRLCSSTKFFGVIAIQRAENQPSFDTTDIKKAKILLPHLIDTFETATLMSTINGERKLLRHCLEYHPDGIILLDCKLDPLYSNRSARQICSYLSSGKVKAGCNIENVDFYIPSVIREDCVVLRRLSEDERQLDSNNYNRVIRAEGNNMIRIEYSVLTQPAQELSSPLFLIRLMDSTASKRVAEEIGLQKLGLTGRELAVAECVSKGLTNKEIARQLCISRFTVENHLKSIFKKAGVENRTQLANLLHSDSSFS